VVVERQGSVEGIAFEALSNALYWTGNNDATIFKLSLNATPHTLETVIKLGPDDKPRGIAIDSCDS
jgi:integrin beta 2